MTLDTCHRQVR